MIYVTSMCASPLTPADLTLAQEGRSDYVIVIAQEAEAPERTAARELQSHLQAVTGARLPIYEEAQSPAGSQQIVVGPGERLRQAAPPLDLAALGHDGIVLRTVGDTLYLFGGRPRGTLYAVYTFLEDVVGCRWWTSTESYLPSRSTLTVPALNQVYVPQLQYRQAHYRDAFHGVFAARLKFNGGAGGCTPEYGGHYTLLGWCHTFYQLLPPEKYFAEHPEWYSEVNGQRRGVGAQLCLTNEAMRAELTRNALELIRANPTAGMISISQNDRSGYCECAACQAVVAEEGALSGVVLRFVNAVAEEIEKQYPDFLVETTAYSETQPPPQVTRPRGNVLVRLCGIGCDFGQPLGSGEHNRGFREDLEAWSAISPHLFIWNYVANFSNFLLPHPNLHTLADDIRTFVANKAIGLFEQGDAGSTCGDFVELRVWLLAHLMWDPARDEQALIREFLQGYYGAAAEPLEEYLDLRTRAIERAGIFLKCGRSSTADWLTEEDLTQSGELFDRAAELVREDPVLSTRVRRARLPLDYAWLQWAGGKQLRSRLGGEPFAGTQDLAARVEDFITTAEGFKVGLYGEGREFGELAGRLRALTRGPAAPVPLQVATRSPQDWFDAQEDEMRLATGTEQVEDPSAANGRSAQMPGSYVEFEELVFQWGAMYQFPDELAELGPWQVWAVVRVEPRAETGNALSLGISDKPWRTGEVAYTKRIEDLPGAGWHTVDLGVHALTGENYVWVGACRNPETVEAVYVDRFFFSREVPQ